MPSKPTALDAPLPPTPYFDQAFELEDKLGEGGMGQVFRVRDRRYGREAALKILKHENRSASAPLRFTREARLTAWLDHPAIPPVYEFGQTRRGELFLVMKLVRGRSLRAILEEQAPEGRDGILEALIKVCEALAYAHKRGVVHRDIKPENIMVGRHGEVYLMDWGIARAAFESSETDNAYRSMVSRVWEQRESTERLTLSGAVIGSWGYMSPEQASGEDVTVASDIYSLGAILYELLYGHPPVIAPGPEGLIAMAEGSFDFPRVSAGELRELCRRCLAKDPRSRPESAEALAEALRSCRRREEVRGVGKGLFAGLVLLLALIAFAGLWLDERARRAELIDQARALEARLRSSEPEPEPDRVDDAPEMDAAARARELYERSQLLDKTRSAEAMALLDQAIALDPKTSLYWRVRGSLHMKKQRYRQALADYEAARRLDPKDQHIFNNRGAAFERLGQVRQAYASYSKAIELAPANTSALANRAALLRRMRRYEESLEDYNKVIALRPGQSLLLRGRGLTRVALGQLDEALQDYNEAIALDPKSALAYSNRGDLFQGLERVPEALADYNKAIALDPGRPLSYNNRSGLLIRVGRLDDALRDLDRALTLEPKLLQAWANRGQLYHLKEDYRRALADFERAVALNPAAEPKLRHLIEDCRVRLKAP